jgi:hypothetical protein
MPPDILAKLLIKSRIAMHASDVCASISTLAVFTPPRSTRDASCTSTVTMINDANDRHDANKHMQRPSVY